MCFQFATSGCYRVPFNMRNHGARSCNISDLTVALSVANKSSGKHGKQVSPSSHRRKNTFMFGREEVRLPTVIVLQKE
ncbi:hypothetical protein Hanom_Chr08g00702881 [Helianthus anomalus]